jgi:hypothetical protein
MEWFSLVLWGLIAAVALPLGLAAIAQPLLAVQALAVLGGLAMSVLWVFGVGDEDTAWVSFACAVIATFALSISAAWVVSGDREVSRVGQSGEEIVASLVGLTLPLVAVAGLLMLAIAAGGLTFS